MDQTKQLEDTANTSKETGGESVNYASEAAETKVAQQMKQKIRSLRRLLISRLQIIASIFASIMWSPVIPNFLIDILRFITNIFTINVPGLLTSVDCLGGGGDGGMDPMNKWYLQLFFPFGVLVAVFIWYVCLPSKSTAKSTVREASIQLGFVWLFETIVTSCLKPFDCTGGATSGKLIMDPTMECPLGPDGNAGVAVTGILVLLAYVVAPYFWLCTNRSFAFCGGCSGSLRRCYFIDIDPCGLWCGIDRNCSKMRVGLLLGWLVSLGLLCLLLVTGVNDVLLIVLIFIVPVLFTCLAPRVSDCCGKSCCRSCEKEWIPYYVEFGPGSLGIKLKDTSNWYTGGCYVNYVEPGSQAETEYTEENHKLLSVGGVQINNAHHAVKELKKQSRPVLVTFVAQPVLTLATEDSALFTTVFGWALESYKTEIEGFELWNVISRTLIIAGSTIMYPQHRFNTHLVVMSWSLVLHVRFRPYKDQESNICAILFCVCDVLGAIVAFQTYESAPSTILQIIFIFVTFITMAIVGVATTFAFRAQLAKSQAEMLSRTTNDLFASYTPLERKLLFPVLAIVWLLMKCLQWGRTGRGRRVKIVPTDNAESDSTSFI
jgi:hypothetical protein